jgi:hypothetical protein
MTTQLEARLLATTSGEFVVLVKGPSGNALVLTPEEAVDIANQLLNVAQAARTNPDGSTRSSRVRVPGRRASKSSDEGGK